MRRHGPGVLLACTLLPLLLLAGCRDDDGGGSEPVPSSGPGTSAGTTSSSVPGGNGECVWLTADAVGQALGTPMELTAGGAGGCFFHPVSGADPSVSLTYQPISIDTQDYADTVRDGCDGPVTEVTSPVPDAIAFACVAFGAQGFLYAGDESVVVEVDGQGEDADRVTAAAALLPAVTFG